MVPEVGKTSHFYLLLGVFLDALVMLVDNVLLHQNCFTSANCGSEEVRKRIFCA